MEVVFIVMWLSLLGMVFKVGMSDSIYWLCFFAIMTTCCFATK